MANQKDSALTSATPIITDAVRGLDDPSGTPASVTFLLSAIYTLFKASFDAVYPAADGWTAGTGTWSYSSADAPTFIISINADVTGLIGVGDRIKLTQTTVKYFIVTAVGAFGGGVTLVTVYGGTDYTLANAAITLPFYSHAKAPFGFPLNPTKWTVEVTDVTQRVQATPTANTWYNLGSVSISVPIGLWDVEYMVAIAAAKATQCAAGSTLSTANNSESDADLSTFVDGAVEPGASVYRRKTLSIASKTSYYLNSKTFSSAVNNLYNFNDLVKLIIRAKCAYL